MLIATLALLASLLVIITISVFMTSGKVQATQTQETFEDGDTAMLQRLRASDKQLTNRKARRYNNVSDGMNDFLGGYLNRSGDNEEQANHLIQRTMDGVAMVGSTQTSSGLLPIGVKTSNTHVPKSYVLERIIFCEALKGDGTEVCDALARYEYNDCGVCLKDGLDSNNAKHVGGLYFSEYDKRSADALKQTRKPTVGKCPDRNFVTSRDQCLRRREQMLCEARGTLPRHSPAGSNQCSQCVEQGLSFLFRGPKTKEFTGVLHLITGAGTIVVSYNGIDYRNSIQKAGLRYVGFVIPNMRENGFVRLTTQDDTERFLVGQWTNISQSRVLPFYETIVNKETVQINGTVEGLRVTREIGATEQKNFRRGTMTIQPTNSEIQSFNLQLNIIGFLGEADFDEESRQCPSGAFLGTDTSMRMMKSNPCFAEDTNAPLGKECVSNLFFAAGGTVFGRGFPSDQTKTDAILSNVREQNNVNQVIAYLLSLSEKANTGKASNGTDLSIEDVNSASVFMLGIEVRSPCDIRTRTGPLTDSCLLYLYNNQGVGKKEGSTYKSSFGEFTSFCTPKGSASPILEDGKKNNVAVTTARGKGGVRAVQDYFDTVHRLANTQASSRNSASVTSALDLCYGIKVPNQTAEQTACDQNLIAEFDITKKPINNTQMMRMSLTNVAEFGPMSDVDLILTRTNGQLNINKETIAVKAFNESPGCTVTVMARQVMAFNFWIRCDRTQPGGLTFLLDFRPDADESYIWRPNDGTWWNRQAIHVDGRKYATTPWNVLSDARWHNITVNLNKPFNGTMYFFSRHTGHQALSCEFGPMKFYQQTISDADITRFFVQRPSWANIPNVLGYEHMGCWRDNGRRALPFWQGNVANRDQCAQRARDAGMNTFALQYFGECWVGNHPSDNYEQYGLAGTCPEMGGAWTQQVYFNPDIKPTLNKSTIRPRHSGRCFDILHGSQNEGQRVIQYDCHGANNQRFDYNNNDKTIRVQHSGKCLTVGRSEAFQKITQNDCTGAWNQRWILNEDGSITLENTNMAMDVYSGSRDKMIDIILYPKHGGENQRFNKIR